MSITLSGVLGFLSLIMLAYPFPRAIMAIVVGAWFGLLSSSEWWVIATLAVIGFVIDLRKTNF